jgi:hypothetical protein
MKSIISGAIALQLSSSVTIAVNLAETNWISNNSWTQQFERARQETEFLDDNAEKMLNNNKKWFILMGVIFIGMVYKSLFIPPEK